MSLLLALACARPDGGLAAPTRGQPYAKVHHAWTRELVLDHDFELDLVVRASLLTPELRAELAQQLQDNLELPMLPDTAAGREPAR